MANIRAQSQARGRNKGVSNPLLAHPEGALTHKHKSHPRQFFVSQRVTITIFFLVNLLAAFYAPIQDCDEVFNYWEPTHYLHHHYGLQTWEYAPEFSIRSWLYVLIHAIIGQLASFISSKKTFQFYAVRMVLAMACAFSESRLFSAISRTLNQRIAVMFMISMISSPGMFHASVAYLPSSFSMYSAMLGTASFMDWLGGLKTAEGIMWFGIGAIVGWPFAAALIAPFILEDIYMAYRAKDRSEAAFRYADGISRCLVVLVSEYLLLIIIIAISDLTQALQASVDTFFYHKFVIMPWRIVVYNIFGGSGRGPNIFGTEPWNFYLRNLSLNFNVWFLLAIIAAPLIEADFRLRNRTSIKQNHIRSLVFVSPFYLWLLIFSVQPHKEERFMYPIYPFLCLNCAIALHILLSYIGTSDRRKLLGKIPAGLKFGAISIFVLFTIGMSILRTVGIVTAYQAPLRVYSRLQNPRYSNSEETVCLGKEWYRFPSSYFLPSGIRARFVKSAFDGLLPGQFNEAKVGFGLFPGTWLEPSGMNDQNIEDPGKYIDIDHCTFLVDSYFSEAKRSSLEPAYVLDKETWETLECRSFLDTSETGLLGRIFWIPDIKIIPVRLRRKWGRYCLLRRWKQRP